MLTTMRPCLGVTKGGGKEKPALYKLYDFTKGGTDIVDQKNLLLHKQGKISKMENGCILFYARYS